MVLRELTIFMTHHHQKKHDMIDTFYIGAYWGSRLESLKDIVWKTTETLTELAKIDEQFINWYETGMSRKKALESKINIDLKNIEALYLKGIKKNDLDANGIPKEGLIVGLWTGQCDGESSGISFVTANKFESDYISNNCIIDIPYEGVAKDRLLKIERLRRIMCLLSKIWEPDRIILTSQELKKNLGINNQIGWVTFTKNSNFSVGVNIIKEQIDNHGYLYYLNPEIGIINYTHASELLALTT